MPSEYNPSNTFTLVSLVEPPHLDVHQTVSPALATMGPGIVYSRLLRLEHVSDDGELKSVVECDLCISWKQQGAETYVFFLRPAVYWHPLHTGDNRTLVAQDVVFSLNRQRTPGWPNASLLEAIEDVEAVDDLTVKITLIRPSADFLLSLADGHSKIVGRHAVEVNGDLQNGPTIGTGPWMLSSASVGADYIFERNARYFEDDLPAADGLMIRNVSDEATAFAAFMTRIVDLHRVSFDQWQIAKEMEHGLHYSLFREQGSGLMMAMNTARSPLDRLDLRRAIFYALDPQHLINEIWRGWGNVSVGIPPLTYQGGLIVPNMADYFDNAASAQEFAADTFSEGHIGLDMVVADFGANYLESGRQVYIQLEEMGFDVNMRMVNPKNYVEEIWHNSDYDVVLGPMPNASTVNGFLYSLIHSSGQWNLSGISDSDLDALIEDQAMELGGKRIEKLLEIQEQILEKAFMFMPVSFQRMWMWWPRIKGFNPVFGVSEYFYWSRISLGV